METALAKFEDECLSALVSLEYFLSDFGVPVREGRRIRGNAFPEIDRSPKVLGSELGKARRSMREPCV